MSNNKKIHISADCVSDAKSKMGGNFKSCICGLLDEEYLVEIEITSGTQKFTTAKEFDEWFDSSDPKNYFDGAHPDPADGDLDAEYYAAVADPKS
ncbi:MAG: hypothetical protein NT121_03800 [Chloroflexi bacterium]|nr:hypothetical protein [Chloroflexota bacterium]